MKKPYKLVVFDWDGTLMDSAARIVACFQSAATDIELPVPHPDIIRNFIGIAMREAIEGMFPDANEHNRRRLIERYRHHDSSAESTPSEFFPGIVEMLEELERGGYFLAVATSKGRPGLDRLLRHHGMADLFHATRCADEAFSKPHPQMLLDILDRVGVDPAEALMVGDTEYDLQMARNAGVDSVGVTCGVHAPERLLACEPVVCLEHTAQLPAWLSGAQQIRSGT